MKVSLWSVGGAEYSDCKRYRYLLWRELHPNLLVPQAHEQVLWVMLNPSTATETQDDPTVRRCIGFSAEWGYKRVVVCNLWAFRATDPIDLVAHVLELGSDAAAGGARNDKTISSQAAASETVVVAWGAHVTGRALGSRPGARNASQSCSGPLATSTASGSQGRGAPSIRCTRGATHRSCTLPQGNGTFYVAGRSVGCYLMDR